MYTRTRIVIRVLVYERLVYVVKSSELVSSVDIPTPPLNSMEEFSEQENCGEKGKEQNLKVS